MILLIFSGPLSITSWKSAPNLGCVTVSAFLLGTANGLRPTTEYTNECEYLGRVLRHCGEIGHLSAVCPEKKAPKKPDLNLDTLPPVMAIDQKEAPKVSPGQSNGPGIGWETISHFHLVFYGNHRSVKGGVADW